MICQAINFQLPVSIRVVLSLALICITLHIYIKMLTYQLAQIAVSIQYIYSSWATFPILNQVFHDPAYMAVTIVGMEWAWECSTDGIPKLFLPASSARAYWHVPHARALL